VKPETRRPLAGSLPWTRGCLVCGEENPRGFHLRSRIEDGAVVLDYIAQRADAGYTHIVHGGVAMTLMDEVMTWAAIIAVGQMCVAAEMTTRLVLPIEVGARLRVEARVKRNARRLILTEARVTVDGGQVVSEATGKYVPVSAGKASLHEKDFVHGPGTIPISEILVAGEESGA
jgi:uncharacterized protein (TIGR00369 family)